MQDIYDYHVDALRATPSVLEALLRDCTQERAQSAQGGEEEWSVLQIICHLRDNEDHLLQRLELMRDQADPIIKAWDQEDLARERDYQSDNLHNALLTFKQLRTRHVTALAMLSPADWERTGRHTERGRITIGTQTLRAACHDAVHAAQIARQLSR